MRVGASKTRVRRRGTSTAPQRQESPGTRRLRQALAQVAAPEREKFVQRLHRMVPQSRRSYLRLLGTAGWREATSTERMQLIRVFNALQPHVADAVTGALAGGLARFRSVDKDKRTLLANLAEAATMRHSAFVVKNVWRDAWFNGLVAETANPAHINQSVYGTCGATAIQYAFVQRTPSEYARIVMALSRDEAADMRGGGRLELQHEYWTSPSASKLRRHDDRTPSEQMFQAAVMAYANGGYDAAKDESPMKLLGVRLRNMSGMKEKAAEKAMEKLFGTSMKLVVSYNPWEKDGDTDVIERIRNNKGAPIIVGMDISRDGKWAGVLATTGHFFNVIGVRDGRVYLRNPWGRNASQLPGELYNGAFRVERDSDVWSLPEKEFRNRMSMAVVSEKN